MVGIIEKKCKMPSVIHVMRLDIIQEIVRKDQKENQDIIKEIKIKNSIINQEMNQLINKKTEEIINQNILSNRKKIFPRIINLKETIINMKNKSQVEKYQKIKKKNNQYLIIMILD